MYSIERFSTRGYVQYSKVQHLVLCKVMAKYTTFCYVQDSKVQYLVLCTVL